MALFNEHEKVAELGYFIIKFIEKFELDNSVGLATRKPQIWFIPDLSDDDYELSFDSALMEKFDKNIDKELNKLDTVISDLFGGYRKKIECSS